MSKYSELLKSPKWQKKRLEILNRDNFTCRVCKRDDITLHVHHLQYNKLCKMPWDYPNYLLTTLCENCHNEEHSLDITNVSVNLVEGLIYILNASLLQIDQISSESFALMIGDDALENKEAFKKAINNFIDKL